MSQEIKPQRQKKSTAGKRRIHHIWTDDEINRLIVAVEQHRGLWDFASTEYKLSKLDGWRSVVDDIEVDGVDVNEAKIKWSSLRTTFMVNLAKLKKKKTHNVAWKYFKAMTFLKDNNVLHSTPSTSKLQLESEDSSILEVVPVQSPPSKCQSIVGNQRKSSKISALMQSPSPTTDTSDSQNKAVASLHSSDVNSTFCENLLAELRTLSELKARTLRYKISRLMMDFMEANH